MKSLWILLYSLILIFPLTEAAGKEDGDEKRRIYSIYPLSDTKDTSRYIKELQPGEDLLPGTYNVKARLSLKSKKKKVTSKSLHFEFPENRNSSKEIFEPGWASFRRTFFWNPGSEENILAIPLLPKSTDKEPSITDFDELRIDYRELFLENPSKLGIQMLVSGKTLDKTTAILGGTVGEKQLTPIKKLPISSTSWKEKDYSYLAKRTLGLPFDATWRHARSGRHTVFQRRFNLSLDSFETIDLVMQPGATDNQIESLVCNFRIGFDNFLKSEEMLAWGTVPKKILSIQGLKVLRVDLGQYIQNTFGQRKGIYLEEMIFFLPGKTSEVHRAPVLETINFLAPDKFQLLVGVKNATVGMDADSPKKIDRVLHLSSRREDLSQQRKRLVLDMRELRDKLGWNTKIHSMTLIARPQSPESTAGFDLQSTTAVHLKEKGQPIFLDTEKQVLSQWGGPFLNIGEENQKFEWPLVHAHLSFHKAEQKGLLLIFDENQNNDVVFQSRNENTSRLKKLSKNKNMDKKVDSLVQYRGATIRAHPHFSSWHSESDGLVLQGEEGGWIEINWPVKTNVEKSTRFFLGISSGEKAIHRIQMTPFSRGRPLKQIQVFPNLPHHLDLSNREIDSLKIRMMLHKDSFNLKLDEMAIFQPVAVTPAQALDIPIPIRGEIPLIPKDARSPSEMRVSINQGNLSAILFPKENSPTTLVWATDVNQKMSGIQRVKLNYQVPSTITANHTCWLELTLVGSDHKAQKTVCPKLSSGQIVIPVDDLFRDTPIPSDEVIKFITWKVNFADPTDSKQPLVLGMAITLEGTKFISTRQELIQHSVLEWYGQKIFPASLADSSAADLFSGRNMVSLGNLSIKNISEANLNLKFSGHPYLDSQTLVFEKLEPIAPKILASFMEKNSPAIPLFPKFLPLLLTAALLWWGWKRRWHTFLWKWSKSWCALFWGRIKPLLQRFPRATLNAEKGFLFNRIFGLILLVPGLLTVGWLYERSIGKFALGGIIVLLIGVLWHELRWWFSASHKADDFSASNRRSGNGSLLKNWVLGVNQQFPPFLYLVTAIGLSFLSFNLGHGNDLTQTFLPLLGVIYFYIPWLLKLLKGKLRFWLTTATGLYLLAVIGLLIKWKDGADIFFSFAGIAVVLVWRNLIPHMQPRLEQRWPNLADKVFRGAGTPYISVFLMTLLVSTVFLIIRLKPVAEQIAVVGYYMLVVGVFLEIKHFRNQNQNKKDEMISTGEGTSRA